MPYHIIPDEEALSKCAWCRNHITDNTEVFAAGATFRPDVDLSEYQGHCIMIGLVSDEKPVYMMVTVEGSEAKQEGNDGLFLFCSEECAQHMKKVLAKEISIGKMFDTFHFE